MRGSFWTVVILHSLVKIYFSWTQTYLLSFPIYNFFLDFFHNHATCLVNASTVLRMVGNSMKDLEISFSHHRISSQQLNCPFSERCFGTKSLYWTWNDISLLILVLPFLTLTDLFCFYDLLYGFTFLYQYDLFLKLISGYICFWPCAWLPTYNLDFSILLPWKALSSP